MKSFYLSLCVLALACAAEAASPVLSISRVPPTGVQFSWPSNFVDWQLKSTTNLSSANWQAVTQAPISLGNALAVLFPLTNKNSYFRLEQNSGGCVFQAVPSSINSGGSSTLSWCPLDGVTYRLSPGPGIVTGGSAIVSPAITTIYTLTASNLLGVVTNFATVFVNQCAFGSVSNWNATLNFSYALAPSAPNFSYNISRTAQVTYHLTPSPGSSGLFIFDGTVTGTVSINDREDDSSSGTLITTTTIGANAPMPLISTFVLSINCANGTYNFAAIAAVDAIDTITGGGTSDSSPRIAIAGQVVVLPRPLPVGGPAITGSATLPVVGPFTVAAIDYYTPNDFIANNMWLNNVITDATAGTATVSWSFTPAP